MVIKSSLENQHTTDTPIQLDGKTVIAAYLDVSKISKSFIVGEHRIGDHIFLKFDIGTSFLQTNITSGYTLITGANIINTIFNLLFKHTNMNTPYNTTVIPLYMTDIFIYEIKTFIYQFIYQFIEDYMNKKQEY